MGHIAKECPRKINSNIRGEKVKGLIAKQEKTGVARQSTLNGLRM